MKISLEQLKEIAKAGYVNTSDFCFRRIDRCDELRGDSSYGYGLYPEYSLDRIFGVRFIAGNGLFFETIEDFNHLAAIRKMEELGLIEK